jgi:hypothetical protein
MSTGIQFLLIAAFAGLVAVWHAGQMIRRRAHEYARWLMCAVIAAGCLGFIFQIPTVYAHIDRWAGIANLAYLMAACSFVLCAGLIQLWISTWPGIAPVGARRLFAGYAAVCAILAALFALGHHPVEQTEDFTVAYIRDPWTAAMIVCYLVPFGLCWPWAAYRVHKGRIRARSGGRRWLVHGLTFLEVGLWGAVGYSLALAVVPIAVALGVGGTQRVIPLANSLGAVSAGCSCIGLAARTWGPRWDRYLASTFAGYRDRVRYRQLGPLYRLVVRSRPTVLDTPRGLGLRRRESATALTHQVMAITEGLADLAPFLDADVQGQARAWSDALAEAIVVNAAVTARREGRRPERSASLPRFADLPRETAHHARLSAALALLDLLDLDHGLPTETTTIDTPEPDPAVPNAPPPVPATTQGV